MKLTASPHFPEKRIGYLGLMLLLTEDSDVLMLATNALKNDLNSEIRFVAGLALCAIGNLSTADMSRDLAPEVDKHLKSPLSYIRKKANLAMARCLSKCPELVEDFCDRIASLLRDKVHGVLVTVVQLMTQVLTIDHANALEEGEDPFQTPCRIAFTNLVPQLVKLLRNLLGKGSSSSEYDVGGVPDPFLQVQILTLLRLLGAGNEQASEEMNDVLAQVASSTETAKNAGNAILYECVQTIMGIESEDGLRVLAVNILGRFLLNRDNNIRYVALNTLAMCIIDSKARGDLEEEDSNNAMSALQRHRNTVVDCLKDPDISIRQRALELIYHLVNEENVQTLTAELLNYLVLCPKEHRSDICTRILKVVDRFSPDDRWRVDTLITTLTIAGRESSAAVQSATVVYISRADEQTHAFAVHKLLTSIRDDDGSQHGLLAVGVWCLGEYGDFLTNPYSFGGGNFSFQAVPPSDIVSTLEKIMNRHSCPPFVKERGLTACVKLSSRLADKGDPYSIERLQKLLEKHKTSRSLELQLRSVEYDTLINATKGIAPAPVQNTPVDDLFGPANGGGGTISENVVNAAKEAIARMPVIDIKILQKRLTTDEFANEHDPVAKPRKPKAGGGGDLLDLNDIFGGEPAPAVNGEAVSDAVPKENGNAAKSDLDLLSDIFAAPAPVLVSTNSSDLFGTAPTASTISAPATNPLDLFGGQSAPVPASVQNSTPLDLFGSPSTSTNQPLSRSGNLFGEAPAQTPLHAVDDLFGGPPSAAPTPSMGVRVPAISHAGLSVEFECTKPDAMNIQKSVLVAHFKNSTGDSIYGMNLQVAVPKYVQMQLEPPSSTTIPVSGSGKAVTQKITVTNSMVGTKNLMLKLKLGFTSKGQKIEQMATCSGFPPGQY